MKSRKLVTEKINALAELSRMGIAFEPRGEYEVVLKCPFHDDKHPSLNLNVEKNVYKCHTANCNAKGDIVSLLAGYMQVERKTILADLSSRYDLEIVKSINPETIEKWHQRIWNAGPLLTELHKRAITDDLIRSARHGS
jgi:DNA primase